MGKIFELVEDMSFYIDSYGIDMGGHGTLATGSIFELVREPIPRKKFYKLKPIKCLFNNKFDKFPDDNFLYLRKRNFLKYFKEVQNGDNA